MKWRKTEPPCKIVLELIQLCNIVLVLDGIGDKARPHSVHQLCPKLLLQGLALQLGTRFPTHVMMPRDFPQSSNPYSLKNLENLWRPVEISSCILSTHIHFSYNFRDLTDPLKSIPKSLVRITVNLQDHWGGSKPLTLIYKIIQLGKPPCNTMFR